MNKKWIIAAIAIIFLSFLLRIYSPLSDLPPDISISGSIYTDEGNQCHNSRSKALYGNWFPDDWKITNYNPVVPWIKLAIFKVFGVGLLQVRSVTYIFAFLSLLFFFLTLKSYFPPMWAFAGIFVLGFNFLYIMYNRIGTFETPMIFWMILSLYFLEKYRTSGNMVFPLLSGMAAFTAFVFKMTGAHFIPVPLAAIIICFIIYPKEKKLKKRVLEKGILFLLAGIVVLLGLWVFFFYIPNKEWIKSAPGSYIGNQMFPKNLHQMIGNILAYNWKEQFFKMAPVWIMALLYIPWFFRRLVRKSYSLTEAAFILFLFSHTASLMIMNHRPTRYLIASIPPMVFLAIHFFYNLSATREKIIFKPTVTERVIIFFTDFIWLNFFLYYCAVPLISRLTGKAIVYNLSLENLLFSIILIVSAYILKNSLKNLKQIRKISGSKIFISFFLILFLSISFLTNMNYYILWAEDRTHYVENISKEIGEKIKNGYIAGLTAPVSVLENRNRALFLYPKFVHWEKDTLEKYSITHALLATFNFEISNFFNMWPEKMKNARLLDVYNVKEQFLHLYSFVYPYIDHIENGLDGGQKIVVENAEESNSKINFDMIFLSKDIKTGVNRINIRNVPGNFRVSTGKNILDFKNFNAVGVNIKSDILLHIKNRGCPEVFRYEGEKFPRKNGEDIRDSSFSGKYSRFFDRQKDRRGFIISSNNGKFIPVSEGILKVDFRIRFDKIRSRIRPLAIIDVFDNSDNLKLSEKKIKKKNVNEGEFKDISLICIVKGVKNIEFRVFTTGYSNVTVDFIDVTYYQGKFFSSITKN